MSGRDETDTATLTSDPPRQPEKVLVQVLPGPVRVPPEHRREPPPVLVPPVEEGVDHDLLAEDEDLDEVLGLSGA